MLRFSVSRNDIPKIAAALVSAEARRDLHGKIANEVEVTAKANARAQGGKYFWGQIAQGVQGKSDETAAVIQAQHVASAQKQFGGPIRAKNKRCLTIPISAAAIYKTVDDFTDIFRYKSEKGDTILAVKNGDSIQNLFVLKTKTKPQRAFPWFPNPDSDLGLDAALKTAEDKFAAPRGFK
jgi:hypothetical protein